MWSCFFFAVNITVDFSFSLRECNATVSERLETVLHTVVNATNDNIRDDTEDIYYFELLANVTSIIL